MSDSLNRALLALKGGDVQSSTSANGPYPAGGTKTPEQRVTADRQALDAARQFETMMIADSLKSMVGDSGLGNPDGIGGGGNAERLFHSLLLEQYAEQMSQAGGLGIAKRVYSDIVRMGTSPQIPASAPIAAYDTVR